MRAMGQVWRPPLPTIGNIPQTGSPPKSGVLGLDWNSTGGQSFCNIHLSHPYLSRLGAQMPFIRFHCLSYSPTPNLFSQAPRSIGQWSLPRKTSSTSRAKGKPKTTSPTNVRSHDKLLRTRSRLTPCQPAEPPWTKYIPGGYSPSRCLSLQGRPMVWAIFALSGCAIMFFGYDTAVMSQVNTNADYLRTMGLYGGSDRDAAGIGGMVSLWFGGFGIGKYDWGGRRANLRKD